MSKKTKEERLEKDNIKKILLNFTVNIHLFNDMRENNINNFTLEEYISDKNINSNTAENISLFKNLEDKEKEDLLPELINILVQLFPYGSTKKELLGSAEEILSSYEYNKKDIEKILTTSLKEIKRNINDIQIKIINEMNSSFEKSIELSNNNEELKLFVECIKSSSNAVRLELLESLSVFIVGLNEIDKESYNELQLSLKYCKTQECIRKSIVEKYNEHSIDNQIKISNNGILEYKSADNRQADVMFLFNNTDIYNGKYKKDKMQPYRIAYSEVTHMYLPFSEGNQLITHPVRLSKGLTNIEDKEVKSLKDTKKELSLYINDSNTYETITKLLRKKEDIDMSNIDIFTLFTNKNIDIKGKQEKEFLNYLNNLGFNKLKSRNTIERVNKSMFIFSQLGYTGEENVVIGDGSKVSETDLKYLNSLSKDIIKRISISIYSLKEDNKNKDEIIKISLISANQNLLKEKEEENIVLLDIYKDIEVFLDFLLKNKDNQVTKILKRNYRQGFSFLWALQESGLKLKIEQIEDIPVFNQVRSAIVMTEQKETLEEQKETLEEQKETLEEQKETLEEQKEVIKEKDKIIITEYLENLEEYKGKKFLINILSFYKDKETDSKLLKEIILEKSIEEFVLNVKEITNIMIDNKDNNLKNTLKHSIELIVELIVDNQIQENIDFIILFAKDMIDDILESNLNSNVKKELTGYLISSLIGKLSKNITSKDIAIVLKDIKEELLFKIKNHEDINNKTNDKAKKINKKTEK